MIGNTLRRQADQYDAAVVSALREEIGSKAPAWIPGDARRRAWIWSAVRESYREHRNEPLWVHGSRIGPRGLQLAAALPEVGREGLDPDAYGASAIRMGLEDPDPARTRDDPERIRAVARLDVRLTAAFLACAKEVHDGRLPSSALDPDWLALRDTLDTVRALKGVLGRHERDLSLDAYAPPDSGYQRLRAALARYRDLAAAGAWSLPSGPKLERGSHDARCRALRVRLVLLGDLADSSGSDAYDLALQGGVRRFQARHGLPATGILGNATRAELNVPAAERVLTLEMNLERARWMPGTLPEPHVIVNIPEFRLAFVNGGMDSLSMRVVVGRKVSPSPVFSDVITYVEMNPTWGVPRRLVIDEVVPGYRRDPEYFAKHHMRALQPSRPEFIELDPSAVNWDSAATDTFQALVRQDAGPENPLGRIKFMCPNEYDVYLHDTPARGYFAEGVRALSHGCVRVERPWDLAEFLLPPSPLAARDSLDAIVASEEKRLVGLKRKVPVHLVYRTAWVDSAGGVQFRPDVYGLDRRIADAIRSGQVSNFEINAGVVWQPAVAP